MQKDFQKTDRLGTGSINYWLTKGDNLIVQNNYTPLNLISITSYQEVYEFSEHFTIAVWYRKGLKDRTAYLDLDTGHD